MVVYKCKLDFNVRNTNNSLEETVTCKILYLCGGYYNYDNGYLPEFKGSKTSKEK
ncbi:MAG: hypothetical protein Ct9H90mP4_06500 [Gammaproteobacteria bacterium]|nr:MAG: hypothetical protein Ct9H90mP4_06500 [Gammaproteobacteria bacterium]